MTRNHLIRSTQALLLAAIVTALTAPAVALAGANSRYGPHDGWYTYATSVTKSDRKPANGNKRYGPRDGWYTYATSVTKSDRKAANGNKRYGPPDGWYTHAVSLTSSAKAITFDGRSADTRDAADAAQLQVADGRSPDTRDAAQTVQPIELVSPAGFDWKDAGIGAGMGAALMTLLAGSIFLLTRRRNRVQTT